MTTQVQRLPHLEAEQDHLGWLGESVMGPAVASWPPWLTASEAWPMEDRSEIVTEEMSTGQGAGQLSIESHQQILQELGPGPRQLALLPDPAPWEADPEPYQGPSPGSRLSRRRIKLGITPGQASLF